MATAADRLALIITANGGQAVTELGKVGQAAEKNLGAAENRIDRLSHKMTSFGAGALAAGAVAASGLKLAADATQDLADSVDKADATFGSSKGLEQYADGAATSMGKSKAEALDAASAYGLLLKQAGLGGAALAESSAGLAQRTADLAEKYKKPYEEVQQAIENVLKTGSNKSLKGLLGINVQLKPEDLKGLDTAAKTTKILDALMAQTANSAGFFASSVDDAGVRLAQVQAKAKNELADFGEAALPAMVRILDVGEKVLDLFDRLPAPIKDVVGTLAVAGTGVALLGGGLSVAAGGALKLVPGLKGAVDGFKAGEGAAGRFSGALGAVSPAAIGVTAALSAGIAVYAAYEARQAAATALAEQFTSALEGSASATEARAALIAQINSAISGNDADSAFTAAGLGVNEIVDAVNQAPGSFDKFKGSVDGVLGPLENLDSFLGSFGDFTGITDQIAELRVEAEKLPAASRQIMLGLLDQLEAGKITDKQYQDIVETLTRVDNATTTSTQNIARQAQTLYELVPAAEKSAKAQELFNTATDDTAGAVAQQDALAQLARLFPQAADGASVTAGEFDTLGAAASDATGPTTDLGKALQEVREGADGGIAKYASGLSATRSAVDGVTSAIERRTQAEKKLADLNDPVKRNERVADALDRVASAEDTLSDSIIRRRKAQEQLDALMKRSVVAGSVPLVQDITEAADEAVRQAQLQLEQARTNFGVGSAQDIAAQQVLAAAQSGRGNVSGLLDAALAEEGAKRQNEINDLLAEQADNERTIARNRKDLGKAQGEAAEAAQGPDPAEVAAAQQEVVDANLGVQEQLLQFAAGVESGKVSIEDYSNYLDQLVQNGIISPEAAAGLKANMEALVAQAGLAAAALGGIVAVSPGLFAAVSAMGGIAAGAAGRLAGEAAGRIGATVLGQISGAAIGGIFTAKRASGGPAIAGQTYQINENGQEFFTPSVTGYVVNAERTRQIARTGGQQSGGIVNHFTIKSTDPKRSAEEVIRRQRAAQFHAGMR